MALNVRRSKIIGIIMWLIGEFEEDGSVEVLPEKWLQGKSRSFWPPCNNMVKIRAMSADQVDPKSNWLIFKLKRIFSRASKF